MKKYIKYTLIIMFFFTAMIFLIGFLVVEGDYHIKDEDRRVYFLIYYGFVFLSSFLSALFLFLKKDKLAIFFISMLITIIINNVLNNNKEFFIEKIVKDEPIKLIYNYDKGSLSKEKIVKIICPEWESRIKVDLEKYLKEYPKTEYYKNVLKNSIELEGICKK